MNGLILILKQQEQTVLVFKGGACSSVSEATGESTMLGLRICFCMGWGGWLHEVQKLLFIEIN